MAVVFSINAFAEELRVLRQPGIGVSRPLLEAIAEALPAEAKKLGINDVKITYKDFQVGADSVPLMLAGDLDILPTGTNVLGKLLPKMGDNVKVLTGIGTFGYKLVCSDPAIKSVKDFKPDTKVAFKSLMAAEHFFLKSVAKKEFGSYDALDKHILIMPRPQIRQMMEAGDKTVTCAIPGTPIQDILLNAGKVKTIAQSDYKDTVGVSVVSFASKSWIEKNPKMAEAWIRATKVAVSNYKTDPKKYIAIWREADKMKDSVDQLYQNMKDGDVQNGYGIDHVAQYVNLMIDLGVTNTHKRQPADLAWRYDLIK